MIMNNIPRFFILAGSFREAEWYASTVRHWSRKHWNYVYDIRSIRGIDNIELHRVGT